jgi:hypothetical protein
MANEFAQYAPTPGDPTADTVRTSRQVNSTGGLTGGGDLSADRTLQVASQGITFARALVFVSGLRTGTGSSENVAHGLGATPSLVLVAPQTGHDGVGGQGNLAPTITEGAHDSTDVVVTVTSGAKYKLIAWA